MTTKNYNLTRPMIQQQLSINARQITFYLSELGREKQDAKAAREAESMTDAVCADRFAAVYRAYIARLSRLQKSLKWELKHRKGLSAIEAAGKWPVPDTRKVH